METTKQETDYQSPQIEKIEIDNEVALQLESTPPKAPGEAGLQTPDCFNTDPFKRNKA